MKDGTFQMIRAWAGVTGLVLAIGHLLEFYVGIKTNDTIPMLVAGIGGFELMLFGQDMMRKRKHG